MNCASEQPPANGKDNSRPEGALGPGSRRSLRESPPQPSRPHARFILVLISLLSIGLDLFFFTGFYASDDISYFGYAVNILRDGHYNVGLGNSRLTIVGWNFLGVLVFGWNAQIIAASYVLWHQALNILTFLLARRLFDWKVGLLAAYGTATLPLMIIFSTCISPDIPLACFCVLSLYAFLRGLDARRHRRQGPAYRWLLLAGISVGFAYMAKEPGLLLLPFYFVLWLASEWREKKLAAVKRGAAFAAGFFTMFALETTALTALNQGRFFRLGWTVTDLDTASREAIGIHGTAPLERLQWVNKRLNATFIPPGWKVLVCACVVMYPIVRRGRWAVFALPLWLFTYLTWGTMRWTEYLPPSIQARYYIPAATFFLILHAAVLIWVLDWITGRVRLSRWRRLLQVAALAFLIVHPLTGLRGPDQVAGKMYKAAIVGSATRALQHAAQQDDRPIVLSAYLSGRMYRLLQAESVTGVLLNSEVSYKKGLESLVDAGGWHYIEVDPERVGSRPVDGLMDQLMHWFIRDRTPKPANNSPLARARRIWSLDAMVPKMVKIPGYHLAVRRIEHFGLPRARSVGFLLRHLGMLNDWVVTPDPSAKSVLLLDVVAQRVRPRPQEQRGGYHEMELRESEWDASPASGVGLERVATGGLRLTRPDSGQGHIWLVPREGTPLASVRLEPGTLCKFIVYVEMGEGVSASLIVNVAGADADEETPDQRRVRLRQGKNWLSLHAADRPLRCTPAVKVSGAGEFVIKLVALEQTSAAYFRDHTELLSSWMVSSNQGSCDLQTNARGGPNLSFKLPPRECAWLRPPESLDAAPLELPPRGCFDFSFRVQLSKLAATSRVELVFYGYGDPRLEEVVFERRIDLKAGRNRFSLRTGSIPTYFCPIFKAFGRGRFSIQEFTIISPD